MNDKKVIEIYKSVRNVERAQPQPLKPEDLAYIKRTIEDGLAQAIANPNPETRSLAEIIDSIESDKSKSPERKEFELRIARDCSDRRQDQTLSSFETAICIR
jgi:hypothetical protein